MSNDKSTYRYSTESESRAHAVASLRSWIAGEKAWINCIESKGMSELKARGNMMPEKEFREYEDLLRQARLRKLELRMGLRNSSLLAREARAETRVTEGEHHPELRVVRQETIAATGAKLGGVTFFNKGEKRSASGGLILGWAALYDSPSCDLGGWDEVLERGCFKEVVKRSDCRCLGNHDANQLLGRQNAGTLELTETLAGLYYRCYLPKSQTGAVVAESIQRGDTNGCSFAFIPGRDRWQMSKKPGQLDRRVVLEIEELFDVGPVTYPAYPETSVSIVTSAA